MSSIDDHSAASRGRPADPLLFDAERLQRLASEPIVRRGVAYFKEDRVRELGWEGARLWASVEGSRPDAPYQVEIAVDRDGELEIDCSCPFDWEPACKHAVAALLAYAARQDVTEEQVQSAADIAVEDRRKRARSEVVVEHIAGDPFFGTWTARSLRPTGVSSRTYRIELRSVSKRINHCTCPDFATNRLGTCKHIEAVIHRLHTDYGARAVRIALDPPKVSVVFLDWEGEGAPRIRVQRSAEPERELRPLLEAYFDRQGFLQSADPASLFAFRDRVRGREDVYVSEDAIEYAQRLSEARAGEARGREIREMIRRSGGRIEGVRARLYPYQVDGVAFLASVGRGLLADDMGLGKTLQAIVAAIWLERHEGVKRVLIVCPASLKHQWARELTRFTEVTPQVVGGDAAARTSQYRSGASFTIVNYELALRDHARITRELSPDLLILDEAQRIKNWRTKTADAIKSLSTRYAFVLTGTPLENRLEDLYSLMQVVDRRVLGPLWHFLLDFHITDARGKVLGYRNLSELRKRLRPVLLRRDRAIVSDQLPERVEERIDVPMTEAQRALHDSGLAAAARLGSIAKRRPLTPSERQRLMAALQQTRMACDAVGLGDSEHGDDGSPKLDELRRLFEELCLDGGRKAVVFSEWERMTAMAEAVALDLGIGTVRLHGGVPAHKRGALIDRFRDDPATQVFLSTDAGGVGLNLQAASVFINLDIPWNPAVLDQRIARVHRLGQRASTLVLLLVSTGSYEERVLQILASKRQLFAGVLHDDAVDDVIGVSKRTLEVAMDAIDDGVSSAPREAPGAGALGDANADGASVPEDDGEPPAPEDADETPGIEASPSSVWSESDQDPQLVAAIERLQRQIGARLDRVLATSGGLLALVSAVATEDAALAQSLSAGLAEGQTVAVLDIATWASLGRLGLATQSAPTELWGRGEEEAPNPFDQLARRKLAAGEQLVEAGSSEEGVALLAEAMVAATARDAGATAAPSDPDLTVWLYADIVPKGVLTMEEAGELLRARGLAASDRVPPELATRVLEDARALVTRP